jgi:cytosine/adenosine deaminase-related metal-dependent hydrolase
MRRNREESKKIPSLPEADSELENSRRRFLQTGSGLLAGTALWSVFPGAANAQQTNSDSQTLARIERQDRDPNRRTLVKGGTIISMDPKVGDFLKGDVLIEGKKIVNVAANITAKAETIDASSMIVIPGFVDTHRHCWENQFRRIIPNADIAGYNSFRDGVAQFYKPEDMYAANLVSALGCIDSGVTCVMDWSHNSRSADLSDGAIQALFDSGVRAIHGYSAPADTGKWDHQHPQDLIRLKKKYFSSDDQLVTVAMATLAFYDGKASDIVFARKVGVRTTMDGLSGTSARVVEELNQAHLLGPDLTFIHCTAVSDVGWRLIADNGVTVGMAPTSDMQIGLGPAIPPIQKALDFGLRPALSVDVECSLPTDWFTQMRVALYVQRSAAFNRKYRGEPNPPAPITMRDVLEFGTVQGAKANGLLDKCGTLTPGKEADIVLIRADEINNMPLNNAIATVVSGADTRDVDTVIIAGKLKKYRGKLLGVDMEKVRRLVHQSRDGILARGGHKFDPITA